MRKVDMVHTGDIAAALKITAKQERELLNNMSRSGMIIRLKRRGLPCSFAHSGGWALGRH